MQPEDIFNHWTHHRYMEALAAAWRLPRRYNLSSWQRKDIICLCASSSFRACRDAVAAAQQGETRGSPTMAGVLLNEFSPPPALINHGEDGHSEQETRRRETFRRRMILAHLRCVDVAINRQWTSQTLDAADLREVADDTGCARGFPPRCGPGTPARSRWWGAATATHGDLYAHRLTGRKHRRRDGVVADLTLERLPDGTGSLYPIPELGFVYRDAHWRRAERQAYEYVQRTVSPPAWDVRWRLARRDQKPLPPTLQGDSLGAALALGLTKLAGGLKDLSLEGVSITAAIDGHGTLSPVGGEFAKLLAAARERSLPRLHTVLVAEAQRGDVERIDASLLRDDPGAEFRVMCAATLQDATRLLTVDAETRWGDIIDCTPELNRHHDMVGRSWLREWVQAFVDSHSSGYLLLTGGPGIGKSAFVAAQVRQRPSPTVSHFIKRGMGNWDEPEAMLRSLTAQLRRKYALPQTDTEARMTPSAACAQHAATREPQPAPRAEGGHLSRWSGRSLRAHGALYPDGSPRYSATPVARGGDDGAHIPAGRAPALAGGPNRVCHARPRPHSA